MDAQIEHVQHVLEDKLSQLPSQLHRFQCYDTEYWYYVGKSEAYEEVLMMIKKSYDSE
jgi:hypothetical protein